MKLLRRVRPSLKGAPLLAILLIAAVLLSFKLASLNPGLAATEVALPTVNSSLQTLWNEPLEAPIHIARLLVALISPSTGIGLSRLPSVVIGLCIVVVMYWLLKKWYGQQLALFGMALLITAPWFLHVSRLATNDVVYPLAMAVLMLLACLWHKKQWTLWLIYGSALTIAGLLYTPGTLWLLLALVWFERQTILANLMAAKKHVLAAASLILVLCAPLIHALTLDWDFGKSLLAIPANLPEPLDFAINFLQIWQYIFVGGYQDAVHNLGGLPLVNIFVSLGFTVGLFLYAKHRSAVRTKQLTSLWLIGTALIALGGDVSYSLIIPLVVVLAVGGIGYLLHLWLKTFPRNPYARAFGVGLLGLVIAFAVAYNLTNYYRAWPHAPEVRAAFTRQL